MMSEGLDGIRSGLSAQSRPVFLHCVMTVSLMRVVYHASKILILVLFKIQRKAEIYFLNICRPWAYGDSASLSSEFSLNQTWSFLCIAAGAVWRHFWVYNTKLFCWKGGSQSDHFWLGDHGHALIQSFWTFYLSIVCNVYAETAGLLSFKMSLFVFLWFVSLLFQCNSACVNNKIPITRCTKIKSWSDCSERCGCNFKYIIFRG